MFVTGPVDSQPFKLSSLEKGGLIFSLEYSVSNKKIIFVVKDILMMKREQNF